MTFTKGHRSRRRRPFRRTDSRQKQGTPAVPDANECAVVGGFAPVEPGRPNCNLSKTNEGSDSTSHQASSLLRQLTYFDSGLAAIRMWRTQRNDATVAAHSQMQMSQKLVDDLSAGLREILGRVYRLERENARMQQLLSARHEATLPTRHVATVEEVWNLG